MSGHIEFTSAHATILGYGREHALRLGAFKLAERELGIEGQPRRRLTPDEAAAGERRVTELTSDPGFADAEVCHDCSVLLPFPLGPAYAIDSASVCEPCARERYGDQAAEHLIA